MKLISHSQLFLLPEVEKKAFVVFFTLSSIYSHCSIPKYLHVQSMNKNAMSGKSSFCFI